MELESVVWHPLVFSGAHRCEFVGTKSAILMRDCGVANFRCDSNESQRYSLSPFL